MTLPTNDNPEADPRPAPAISPARAAAIDALVKAGKARSRAHAEFKARAGALTLPD